MGKKEPFVSAPFSLLGTVYNLFFAGKSLDQSVICGFCINKLAEHLNIVLFELARTYHAALQKVDVSGFSADVQGITSLVNNYH